METQPCCTKAKTAAAAIRKYKTWVVRVLHSSCGWVAVATSDYVEGHEDGRRQDEHGQRVTGRTPPGATTRSDPR